MPVCETIRADASKLPLGLAMEFAKEVQFAM